MQMFPDSDECETLLRNYVTFLKHCICCVVLFCRILQSC